MHFYPHVNFLSLLPIHFPCYMHAAITICSKRSREALDLVKDDRLTAMLYHLLDEATPCSICWWFEVQSWRFPSGTSQRRARGMFVTENTEIRQLYHIPFIRSNGRILRLVVRRDMTPCPQNLVEMAHNSFLRQFTNRHIRSVRSLLHYSLQAHRILLKVGLMSRYFS